MLFELLSIGKPSWQRLEQMVEWTAAWLGKGGETLGKPTRFENREGNY